MEALIAIVVAMTWGIGSSLLMRKHGYEHKGKYEWKKAKERGDVAMAKLVSSQCFDSDVTGNKMFDGIYYRNVYVYEVDGVEYQLKETSYTAPEKMEICYDRNKPSKWIDPDKRSLWDHLWFLSVPAVFVTVLLLLVD